MKKLVSVFIIILFLITITGCSEEKTTYTVLMKDNNNPYSYINNGSVTGLEADIINAVADAQGFQVNLVTDENADFVSCSSDFTNGSEDYDYTSPFYQRGIIFTTPKTSNITTYEQLINATIGVTKGSFGEDFATQIASQYNLTVKKYTDNQKMHKDAQNNSIAGFFDDELVIREAIKNGENLKTFENAEKTTSLSFAVNKDKNKDFIENFNAGLEKISKNGEYKDIIEKY